MENEGPPYIKFFEDSGKVVVIIKPLVSIANTTIRQIEVVTSGNRFCIPLKGSKQS